MTPHGKMKNYPFTCWKPLWSDWTDGFTDVNINEALTAAVARDTLERCGDELEDDRREQYESIVESYDGSN